MGTPTNMLVAVAIMYNNPQGLTKEEILAKFGKIKITSRLEIGEYLNLGIHGFSRIFNLGYSEDYLTNKEKYWNEEYKYPSKGEWILENYQYSVFERSHKSIGKTKMHYESVESSKFGMPLFEGNKVGEYVWEGDFTKIEIPSKYQDPKNSFIVRKILDQKIEKEEDLEAAISYVKANETMEVEVVQLDSKMFEFDSLEDLWHSYPEYHPEKMYDFNQESGFLYPYETFSKNPFFRWIKKGEKYFLDLEHFSKILNPNSAFGNGEWVHTRQEGKSKFSLTDVILTSEAIRRRNWGKLSYNAFFTRNNQDKNRDFIYGNENTFRRYESAIITTEAAIEGQKKGLTNSEFLRNHLLKTLTLNQIPYPEIKRMLKEEIKKGAIEKRKRTMKLKREEELEEESDIPF